MHYLRHTKNLVVPYLKFKLNWGPVFYLVTLY